MTKYLDTLELNKLIAVDDFSSFQTISTDSYSDYEVFKTIEKRNGMKLLLYCALQTAIVGYGNKSFGEFKYNGENVSVTSLYKEYGVKDDLGLQAKLEPGDLTPRRLQRFYRGKIKDYLEEHSDVYPYLWKKYSTLDKKYRSITFPGAESLVETKEEGLYLIETYRNLDYRLGVMITERIKRTLLARNIVTIEDCQKLQMLK